MNEETAPIKIQHEYVTDAGFVSRAIRAFLAFRVLRVSFLLPYGFMTLLALLLALSAFVGNTNAWVPLAILVGFFALLWLLVVLTLRRGFARSAPIGSRYAIGLGENAMRLESPLASSEIKYFAFRSVSVCRGFVFLQQRSNKQYALLPIELLPGADLERLRSAIAGANPYS